MRGGSCFIEQETWAGAPIIGAVVDYSFFVPACRVGEEKDLLKRTFILLAVLLLSSPTFAADQFLEPAHWSLEVKGGSMAPALENWAYYYGRRTMPEYAVSLAYKVLPQLEFGVGVGRIKTKGRAQKVAQATLIGEVTYELDPVNVFLMARGVFIDDQWLVPYLGGGWTRMYYRQAIQDQGTVRGHADGYHARAGLQLLLDGMDPAAAARMYQSYSIFHTYIFIEAEYTKAIDRPTSINLGGTSYLGGLLFEF
jgi:hypothetical protein